MPRRVVCSYPLSADGVPPLPKRRVDLDSSTLSSLAETERQLAVLEMIRANNTSMSLLRRLKRLSTGATFHAADGSFPLYIACNSNNSCMAHLLLDEGRADINQRRADNNATALHAAAQQDYLPIAQMLIEGKADLNLARSDGNTALHAVAQAGHCDMARLLVSRKAHVNLAANSGAAALHLSSQERHADVARLLLSARAESNQRTVGNAEITALYIAASKGYTDVASVLLEGKADINQGCGDGSTPLHVAAQEGHTESALLLCRSKANLNQGSFVDNSVPLHVVASKGNYALAELLVMGKVNVNHGQRDGTTALHLSCARGDYNLVQMLINVGGADANQISTANSTCTTPLRAAAQEGHIEIVRFLINEGNADFAEFCNGPTKSELHTDSHIDTIVLQITAQCRWTREERAIVANPHHEPTMPVQACMDRSTFLITGNAMSIASPRRYLGGREADALVLP